MTGLSTLPSTREQARRVLLLLGVPTPARLVADVHAVLFDGDLSVSALAALMREEEQTIGRGDTEGASDVRSYVVCPALHPDLTAARGLVTLSTWPVAERIRTPAVARAEAIASAARIAELVAMRPGGSGASLLRQLAELVPGGPEALDLLSPPALAGAARAALSEPALASAVAAEAPIRQAAAARAVQLDRRQQLFGVPSLPHQRGRA